jgi:hypothetical protein
MSAEQRRSAAKRTLMKAIVTHLQLQRFVSFIALFCGERIGLRMRLTYPSLRRLSVDGLSLVQ